MVRQHYQRFKNHYKNEPAHHTEARRVGRFSVIGVMNTIIDFTVLGLLHIVLNFPIYYSNLVSTSCAMVFSFIMNKHVVFHDQDFGWGKQALKFIGTTAFGLWAIQSTIVLVVTDGWRLGGHLIRFQAPVTIGLAVAHKLGLGHIFSDKFMITYGAKVYGILFSMTWNYFMYRNFVFQKWNRNA